MKKSSSWFSKRKWENVKGNVRIASVHHSLLLWYRPGPLDINVLYNVGRSNITSWISSNLLFPIAHFIIGDSTKTHVPVYGSKSPI